MNEERKAEKALTVDILGHYLLGELDFRSLSGREMLSPRTMAYNRAAKERSKANV